MKSPVVIHLILAAVLFLGVCGAYAFWFLHTEGMQDKMQGLGVEIGEKTSAHAAAGSARDTLAALKAREAIVAGRFVPPEEIVSFLEELEETGRTFGTTVSVLSVTDPSPEGKLTLALSVAGSFDAVMRNIGAIEYGKRASAVKSLTLDSNDDGTWNAALTIVVLTPPSP